MNVTPDGRWNQSDIVITDFGAGGSLEKFTSGNALIRGTPGFASPEQLLGTPHRKSDNYSLAKLTVLILFEWSTAWNLLARPEPERSPEMPYFSNFRKIISGLLETRPECRLEIDEAYSQLIDLKYRMCDAICNKPGFKIQFVRYNIQD